MEEKILMLNEYLHPNHGLLLAAKRSLVNCSSQIATENVGRLHQEKMRDICQEQILVLSKVDKGFPDWKGDIYKHLSTGK